MSISEVTNYLNIALIVLFVLVLVTIALYFLRGLARGWRYGTYRVIAFAILVTVAFLALGPLADALGNWDMTSFNLNPITYSIQNNTYEISASFGTPYSVIQTLVAETLKAYDANLDPTQVQNYAIALSKSLMMLLTLFLDGILLATLGNLFVMLLWHIAFIHTIPKDKRPEAKKKGKLISAFEEVVIGVVIGSMILFPLTSMVNSLVYGWDKTKDNQDQATVSANNDTYKSVQAVVDTYDNSIFSQFFFAWTKNDAGMSYDMALTNFLTQGTYDKATIGVINEMTSFASMGSLLVKGGLLSEKGFDQSKVPFFLTSRYAPELLRSLSQSKLISGLLPYALDVVENIDKVAGFLKVGKGIKFEQFNYSVTFSTLADIYESLIENDVLKSALIDKEGNWGATSDIVKAAFDSTVSTPMHNLFAALDDGQLAVFDAVMEAAVYVACCKSAEEVAANPSDYEGKITLMDFFPSLEGHTDPSKETDVPENYKSIKWGQEIATVFDSASSIIQKDPTLLTTLTEGLQGTTYTINTDHLTAGIFDHLDAYASGLFGVTSSSSSGALAAATSTSTSCLLDSSFVENAMPKFLSVMQDTLNTNFGLTDATKKIDLTAAKTKLSLTDDATLTERTSAMKGEFSKLYNVISAFVSTPEGKAFLKDTKGMPGLYFDPSGNFVGIDSNLLTGLSKGMKLLDQSTLSSAILPKLFKGFMEGDSSPLKSLGLTNLNLNFDIVDTEGNPAVGASLAGLLDAFNANQDLVSYLLASGAEINASNADSVVKRLLSFKDKSDTSGQKTQLANLLKALVDNKIINSGDNIKNLIELYLTKMGFSDFSKLVIPTGDDLSVEMDHFVGVLQAISSENALGLLMNAKSMNTTELLNALKKISFTNIFTAVNDSTIVKSILGSFLDTSILPQLSAIMSSEEISKYSLGFKNVSDWANEGKALDALVSAASEFGDLSNIDYLHSDPEAVSGIIKALAGSGIFQAVQSDNSVKYVFPDFMAGKLITYFVNNQDSTGKYFADSTATGTLTADNFNRFKADFTALNSVNDWTAADGEADKIGTIVRYILRLDGFTTISATTDWRTINRANLQGLLNAVADSDSFGPILTYHLFANTIDAIGSSMPDLKTYSNLDYLLDSTGTSAERKAKRTSEVGYLYDMISAAVDPGFGLLDSHGQLPTSSSNFKLANVSADFLVNPLLTSLSSSQVFNSLKTNETYTAFEEEYAQILVDNSLYSDKAAVRSIISSKFRTNEGKSDVGAWQGEISSLCTLLSDAKALDLDLAALDFNTLFSKNNSAELNENNRSKVEEALKAYKNCKTLAPSLPDLLKKAVVKVVDQMKSDGVSDADDYGLATANFTYSGTDPYDDNEIHCLSYILEDGLITDFTNLGIKDATSGSSVANLLENMAKSQIFNSVQKGGSETETTLEKTMQKVLLKSGYYGTATDATVITNVKTVVLEVKNTDYGWIGDEGEVAKLEAVAAALPTDTAGNDLDLNAFSLTNFFGSDETTQEQQRAKLGTFLNEVNFSGLLYPGLAQKVDSAIASNNTSTISLSGANSYYNGYFSYHDANNALVQHATLGNAYSTSEITILTHLFKDVSGLGNVDLNDIAKIDATKVTTLLKDMVQSRVFNTSADGTSQPVAQKVMSQALLAGGALDSTYYFAANPKDSAGVAAANYSDSASKASYLAKTYFAQDASTHLVSATNLAYIDGDSGSIKSVILAVQKGTIATAVKNNDYASLSESDLTTLLGALNDCKLYEDCVPNLLGNAITGTMASAINGVNLARANPYYIYYEPASGFVYGSSTISYAYDSANKVTYTPVNFENTFESDELATLATLITKLNDSSVTSLFQSSSTTSFNYTNEQIQTIHDLLGLLGKSYVFNLGGPYGGNVEGSTPSALHVNDDLSVFEQVLFNFLDQSGLAKLAYDQAYDYQITGTYAPEAKLYAAIKTFESDFGKSSALNGSTLHSGVWQDEIDYLTIHTDGANAIDGGLLYALRNNTEAFALIQNGSISNLSNLKTVSPTTIRVLLKAMNQVDLVHTAVPYTVASLIEDSLNFKTFSTLSFTAAPNASAFNTESLGNRGRFNALKVTLSSEMASGTYPIVYAYDSTAAGATQVQVGLAKDDHGNDIGHTAGTLVYEFDMGETHPYYFSVDAGAYTIASLTYSINTSNYILRQQEFLSDDGSGNTALDVIANFAQSIYIDKGSGTMGYVDFSSTSDISTLFGSLTPSTSPTGAHLSNILRYIGDPNGFYTRHYYMANADYSPATSNSYDLASRDIVLRRMLSFSYNGTAIDLGKYFAESTNDPATFEGAKDVFTAPGYNAEIEGDWFTNNLASLAVDEALYANASAIGALPAAPSVHAYAEALATLNGGSTLYESSLEKSADSAASGTSRLGRYLAAGQLQRFLNSAIAYAFPENVVVGTYLNFNNLTSAPNSYLLLTNRKTLQPSDWVNPSFYSNNFALLGTTSLSSADGNPGLNILHQYFQVTKLLNLTSVASNPGQASYPLAAADKAAIGDAYTYLDGYLTVGNAAVKRLVQTLYLSTIYDDYLNRLYYHGITLSSPNDVDFFRLPSATDNLASTLTNIPTA
jgi:hypothetical protein